jgi:hypothetical protein
MTYNKIVLGLKRSTNTVTLFLTDEALAMNQSSLEVLAGREVTSMTVFLSETRLQAEWRDAVAAGDTLESYAEWKDAR